MEVALRDFAGLLGVDEHALPRACREFAARGDFRYDLPSARAREDIMRRVHEHIESDKPTRVGTAQRADIWELCWSENLQKFVERGYDPETLVPDFIRPDQPVRLRREYVLPQSARFELDLFQVCRAYLFERFFREAGALYEFGCGSGFNLVALAEQLPGKKLFGLDWSKSSYEMVNLLRDKLGIDITGRHFDFFNPDRSLDLGPAAGVLTMCALEQVGTRHGPFLDYLLEKRPGICVHMEPLAELYDPEHPVDALALRYHRKRGYLDGFLTRLRELESRRRVAILDTRRFQFGSLFHECYSFVAWRPAA